MQKQSMEFIADDEVVGVTPKYPMRPYQISLTS
jgi:predicted membrane GTPase involved in stress response